MHGDDVHYVYADPLVCNCLYVGTQQAYGAFKQPEQQQYIGDEQELAASEYNDAAWNWGAWGPGYGFGPGGRLVANREGRKQSVSSSALSRRA